MTNSPPPIVILGTGRSFTSVISCMIGEHPNLICLPEINIFLHDTVGDTYKRFEPKRLRRRRAGLLRTLAQFHDGKQDDEAIAAADEFVRSRLDWTGAEMANYIQDLVAPRGIVEKSISIGHSNETLNRTREAWPDALYLHITRQPESIVKSMRKYFDKQFENVSEKQGLKIAQMKARVDGGAFERNFHKKTKRLLSFMASLPQGQAMNLHGENFLTDARLYCRQICEWAGIDSSDTAVEAMLHPENNPFAHVGPDGARGGMSPTFLRNPTYSGEPVSVKPMSVHPDMPDLAEDVRSMAQVGQRLGYH
ncbi:MAG: sulfotransferase [Pseudomonadota bacterium]